MTSGIGKRRAAAKREQGVNYERRRQEICEAAARVFNRRGFQDTTIGAVADELSIDRASLYYYISGKEELFDELVRDASIANLEAAKGILDSDQSPPQKLRELIVGLMESYARTYPLLYIYIRENLSQVAGRRAKWAKYMRQLNRDYDDTVTAIIEEGCLDGSFKRVGPPRLIAYGVLGMINWTNRWFEPGKGKLDATEIGEMYAEMIITGLAEGRSLTPKQGHSSSRPRKRQQTKPAKAR